METKVILSKKFTLQGRDFLRGIIIASITAAFVVLQTSIDAGRLEFEWKQIGMAAIGGGVSYVLKNWLLEPAKVITTVSPDADAAQVKSDIKEVVNETGA